VPPQLAKLNENVQNRPTAAAANLNSLSSSLSTNLAIRSIDEPITGDRKEIYKRLQEILVEQINLATQNFQHYKNMGDVANANKFNKSAREAIQDLEMLRNGNARGEPVPLYHYERRTYQSIDSNSDLTDNDLELTIVCAVNLPLPKDYDEKNLTTYVKFEFPFPPVKKVNSLSFHKSKVFFY
jgi:coiled-coil and C2 domain-containing protein 1